MPAPASLRSSPTCPYCGQPVGQIEVKRIRENEARVEREIQKGVESQVQSRIEEERQRWGEEVQESLSAAIAAKKAAEEEAAKAAERLAAAQEGIDHRVEREVARAVAQAEREQQKALVASERAKKAAEDEAAKAAERLVAAQEGIDHRVEREVARAVAHAQKEGERRLASAEGAMDRRVQREVTQAVAQSQREQQNALAATERARKAAEKEAAKAAQRLASVEGEVEERVSKAVQRETLNIEREMSQRTLELERRLSRADTTIDKLKKQVESKAAYELGGIQEQELLQVLRSAFPRDRIEPFGSGAPGADIRHEVVHEGETCGLIIYESKNVKSWQNTYLEKLARDKVEHSADYAILVSTAFPARQQSFCVVEGIPIVHPRHVLHLASIVRAALVEIARAGLTREQTGHKYEEVLLYLQGPDFRNRMEAVVDAADKLGELQHKERKEHEKVWSEQTKLHRVVTKGSSEVQAEIEGILTGT